MGFCSSRGARPLPGGKPPKPMCAHSFHKQGVDILYIWQQVFFSPELFCLTPGKEERKQILFFFLNSLHNSDNRKSKNFTFNICCQTALMLQHLQPDIMETLLGIPVRSQWSFAVLTENLNLYSKVLLLLWSTQGVQRWVSHSPSQPPDPNRDEAYIKSTDPDETFWANATIIGVSHKTEMKVQQRYVVPQPNTISRYTSKCILHLCCHHCQQHRMLHRKV